MKKLMLAFISVAVATVLTSNAQQALPGQTTPTQETSKPKATGARDFPQRKLRPTQSAPGSNNPGRAEGVANAPGHRKPVVNNPGGKLAVNIPGNGNTIDSNVGSKRTSNNNHDHYAGAVRRYRHERHDCDWWKQHYVVIVLVGGGYYYRDAGYWYPAWGYNPNYERYDYDGPIYTYGDLLPDQVIINVQHALQQLGYYAGDLNGSLGVDTRQAIAAYQQDHGLDATGVVDEATVRSLGLI
jgi:hypothetical protein